MDTVRVAVVGFTGYAGQEVVRLLCAHPYVAPVLCEQRNPGTSALGKTPGRDSTSKARATARRAMSRPFQVTDELERLEFDAEALRDAGVTLVMLATPPEVSIDLAPRALEGGVRVIDLSGGFRLPSPQTYERWYGAEHGNPHWLGEAVYGLPELHRDEIREARLVANPGCYATVASLALQPLVEKDWIDKDAGVVCDAKSGVTGAGKRATSKTHFCSVAENMAAYGFFDHRHVAEILDITGLEESEFSFVTQLLPVRRGILACHYFRTRRTTSWQELATCYQAAYGDAPYVRVYPEGSFPDLHSVVETNACHLGIHVDPETRRALVVGAIDNLVKGAAGQAVQNLNLMLGIDETSGLT